MQNRCIINVSHRFFGKDYKRDDLIINKDILQ